MPLEVLASIVVVGLALIYVIMKIWKFDRCLVLASEEIARAEWEADNPTAPALEVIVAASGQSALVRSRRGWGVLWVMGLDAASHELKGGVLHDHPAGLRVQLPDFAAPSVVLQLTTDEIPVWRQQIKGAF
ncbi:hypothetical protein [Aliiroseovarius crassostreae]|uniref:hypothetical protein n=1 Tax=Aliiroseovarius crassostreae TaxID=154981 RepID=UPI0021FD2B84|nr:hypothetical protein [Aliiroseovarius crassostreae]UWQ04295.1 hypothetical protein K3X22_11495 [Aliiroseovarius crassostreae]